ncbi:SCO family protein [Rubellimicrobium aerolatum]|uniref:SCO family protein n=1 Tax=Rubellimicrobium aerolatum TaxID=490979 RepID=A0ABW0SDE3_9RHOB|nr:SCO family protein [Rubellimicrobium aerolatum]MBP1806175.1 cytochrome oxidase Cu insertion factor (SCO1/SenC/PrrC family)/mono/diheme cytochrome c family protein [Rubellimicrobium aerolatum]
MGRDRMNLRRWAGALALALAATTAQAADEIRDADYFTNRPLVTQDGETVRFWDDLLRDRIVVITFIYTDCPNICSVGTARLAQVYDWLGERMGRDIFFYSITLDPENDTPEDLRTFAKAFNVDKGWTFLTGTREDIDAIRYKLGERSEALEQHRSDFVIGNASTGVWRRSSAMGSLTVALQSILELDPEWTAPPAPASASASPEYHSPDFGEALFLGRCASCHTIGEGVRLAPDLASVTLRRDPDWLRRFILAPDAMLTAGDPVAVALDADYPGIRMPSIGLGEDEVDILMAYLAEEDRKLVAVEQAQAEAAALATADHGAHDHGSHDHAAHGSEAAHDHSGHAATAPPAQAMPADAGHAHGSHDHAAVP